MSACWGRFVVVVGTSKEREKAAEIVKEMLNSGHYNSMPIEAAADGPGKFNGVFAIPMQTNSICRDLDHRPVTGLYLSLAHHHHHLNQHKVRLMDQCARFRPGRETAIGAVSAVGEDLADKINSKCRCLQPHPAATKPI